MQATISDAIAALNRMRGGRRKALVCLVLTLVALAFWLVRFDRSLFVDADSFDYAQMGRELYVGNGASTLQIMPRHIPLLHDRGYLQSEHWPNLYRYPLPTFFVAGAMFFTADPISAAMLQSGFWFLASVPVFFLLASRVIHLGPAVACTLLYIVTPAAAATGFGGGTMAFALLIVLTIVYRTCWHDSSNTHWILTGALCGLAFLARTQLVFLAPVVMCYACFTRPQRRWIPAACILGGAFVVMTPWMVRNIVVIGDPLFSFSTSRNLVQSSFFPHADISMQLHAPVALIDVLNRYGDDIVRKVASHIFPAILSIRFWVEMFAGVSNVVLFFFALALVRKEAPGDRGFAAFKWFVVTLILCNFLVVGMLRPDPYYYTMFHPLVILIAAHGIARVASEWLPGSFAPRVPLLVTLLLTLAAIVASSWPLTPRGDPLTGLDRQTFERVQDLTGEGTLIAANDSWKVALLAGRRSLRFPADPRELLEIDRRYVAVDFVLPNDFIVRGRDIPEASPFESYVAYRSFIRSEAFLQQYELVETLPNGAALFAKRGP